VSGLDRATESRDPWSWHPAKAALEILAAESTITGRTFEAFDLTERFGIQMDHPGPLGRPVQRGRHGWADCSRWVCGVP